MQNLNEIIFYTVGHSNVTFEKFLELVKTVDIDLLVDVRTIPYSKYVPQFNREPLNLKMNGEGIGYTYLGDKIGGKPSELEYQQNGKISYELLGRSLKFQEGILLLLKIARPKTVIMCSEENPYLCHRHLLIGKYLLDMKCKVIHVRSDKRLEEAKIVDTQQKLV